LRAFLELVSSLRSEFEVDRLVDLVRYGRVHEFEAAIARHAATLGNTVVAGYLMSAETAARLVQVSFDGVNARAVIEMQAMRYRVIREMTNQQIQVIRQVLERGVVEGLNPIDVARGLRGSIGLTARQEAWVDNYRRLLEQGELDALSRRLRDRRSDRRVRRVIRGGESLTPAEVERMVDRYRERAITYRARNIARTEALAAAHAGSNQMWEQAVALGDVDPGLLVRTWVTSGLPNRRDHHVSMHGQRRPFGVPFVSGQGNLINHPGDSSAPLSETVSCACAVTTRIAPSIEAARAMIAA
jgi:hypothetical protein